ncbi:hypothetical protein MO973_44170 [Paenibacillus sp. TRM 82003]|nr:hypothetical protein [Paenibacillus sp. TRM 82003]
MISMFESLFPSLGGALEGLSGASDRLFILAVAAVLGFGLWRSRWQSRYARRMKRTFEMTNLFVKPKKDKLFPILVSLTAKEDELFYVFRYRLRPGMSVPMFEDKKKLIEASFHAETKVFGKGGIVTIKVKKQKYPVPTAEQSV